MNLPNKLTISRLILVPFFMVALLYPEMSQDAKVILIGRISALIIFIAACITDLYDGRIARKRDMVTNFGKLMDPLVDKIMILTAFIGFVQMRIFPAWIIILILSREFLITGLRTIAATQNRTIGASKWGKHKLIWQVVLIITTLTFEAVRRVLEFAGAWEDPLVLEYNFHIWYDVILKALLYIVFLITMISGFYYLAENIDVIRTEE